MNMDRKEALKILLSMSHAEIELLIIYLNIPYTSIHPPQAESAIRITDIIRHIENNNESLTVIQEATQAIRKLNHNPKNKTTQPTGTLHEKILQAINKTKRLISKYPHSDDPPKKDQLLETIKTLSNLEEEIQAKSIYIPTDIYKDSLNIRNELGEVIHNFLFVIVSKPDDHTALIYINNQDKWDKSRTLFQENCLPLLQKLESKMRKHMGVD